MKRRFWVNILCHQKTTQNKESERYKTDQTQETTTGRNKSGNKKQETMSPGQEKKGSKVQNLFELLT